MPDPDDNDFRGPSDANPFVDDVLTLIGGDAEVTASNWQAEFDWIVTVIPHESEAARLEVMIGPESQVVVHSLGLFWWTFGSALGDDEDGYGPAWTIIEQLVERGGVLRRDRRASQLFDAAGRLISGPNHNGGVRPRLKTTILAPYRTKQ